MQKLLETSFSIRMCVDESSGKFKAKGAESWFIYISNIVNSFFDVLTNKLLKHLPPSHSVDHKIKVVLTRVQGSNK
jgi:hypothetical protein